MDLWRSLTRVTLVMIQMVHRRSDIVRQTSAGYRMSTWGRRFWGALRVSRTWMGVPSAGIWTRLGRTGRRRETCRNVLHWAVACAALKPGRAARILAGVASRSARRFGPCRGRTRSLAGLHSWWSGPGGVGPVPLGGERERSCGPGARPVRSAADCRAASWTRCAGGLGQVGLPDATYSLRSVEEVTARRALPALHHWRATHHGSASRLCHGG